jgi:2-amino-4-hydroxy-6-hydroxymethyldihydropteridine diphosphokinase
VYVGVGSNLGRRADNIRRGLELLEQQGFKIERRSRIYETKPIGMKATRDFLNLAVQARTRLSPAETLAAFRRVEQVMGRGRHRRNTPRTLDLDLLFYDRRVIRRPGLRVPHPRLHERAFVLVPLNDLAPNLVHPVLHRQVRTLLKTLSAESEAKS